MGKLEELQLHIFLSFQLSVGNLPHPAGLHPSTAYNMSPGYSPAADKSLFIFTLQPGTLKGSNGSANPGAIFARFAR
jgi:hypothetical protein